MASAPPQPGTGALPMNITFHTSLGALLVGSLLAMALWGITCVQTYTYLTSKMEDRLWFRNMIISLWMIDTFDSALNCHLMYHYTVSNFLNPFALATPVWSVIIHVAITSMINFIIRSLFIQRVHRLSNGFFPLTLFISAVSLTDLVCGVVITAQAFRIATFAELEKLSTLLYLNFAAGFGADLSVSLALCYLLHSSRTGLSSTDSLINVLMKYTINTGLIVAIDAALGMFTYIAMPNNLIFLGFYLLLSKLYLNSYLATVNAREHLRDKLTSPVSIDLGNMGAATSAARFHVDQSGHSRSRSTGPTFLTSTVASHVSADERLDTMSVAANLSRDKFAYDA